MQWRGRKQSDNIEDRRKMGGGGMAIGGIGALIIVILGALLGVDTSQLLQGGSIQNGGGTGEITPADEAAGEFVAVTLADTEAVWADVFKREGLGAYPKATLVLFKGGTQSGCGTASLSTGPFYCPVDKKVYLDTDFFAVMKQQLGAGGDFAAAYVVAHEVGHYVQDVLGILEKTTALRQQVDQATANEISVLVELQADCYAGIWARYAKDKIGVVEKGDLDEAMNAAAQIGDDTLQRNAGQRVQPESFTHGTSAQRQEWFAQGYNKGSINACDTFGNADL
jgi:uncharacterized protein